ncbi:hypothetical protein QJQ45_024312 [Haematococcus lacustris]|nr:hypothetical protein QJQ45_024312 [Haematococcus lacustris]
MAEGTVNPLPSLGPKDEAVLRAWVTEASEISSAAGLPGSGVDFLALPRCHTAADVADCRAMLERCGLRGCRVVAKLEDVQGLANHEAICAAADALILSRGSLGTCLEPEKMFLAQKMLLHSANNMGKPVFITRLVDTMTDSPRPTRAEATDVANLVLDGADGILLGSETFRGTYPVDVVHTVSAICRAAEAVFDNYAFYRALVDQGDAADRAEAMASSAVRAAHKMAAKLIVVFTVTGRTARLVAKYKPSQPILTVVCTDPANALFKQVGSDVLLGPSRPDLGSHGPQARACLLYRGALPVMMDAPSGQQGGDVLQTVLDYAKGQGLVVSGDRVVVSQCPRHMDSKGLAAKPRQHGATVSSSSSGGSGSSSGGSSEQQQQRRQQRRQQQERQRRQQRRRQRRRRRRRRRQQQQQR